jgi:hypothetical protein
MEVVGVIIVAIIAVGAFAAFIVGAGAVIVCYRFALPILGAYFGGLIGFFFGVGLVIVIEVIRATLREIGSSSYTPTSHQGNVSTKTSANKAQNSADDKLQKESKKHSTLIEDSFIGLTLLVLSGIFSLLFALNTMASPLELADKVAGWAMALAVAGLGVMYLSKAYRWMNQKGETSCQPKTGAEEQVPRRDYQLSESISKEQTPIPKTWDEFEALDYQTQQDLLENPEFDARECLRSR